MPHEKVQCQGAGKYPLPMYMVQMAKSHGKGCGKERRTGAHKAVYYKVVSSLRLLKIVLPGKYLHVSFDEYMCGFLLGINLGMVLPNQGMHVSRFRRK